MKQLTVVAKITAKEGKAEETRKALVDLIPVTLEEEGCLNYNLHDSADEEGVFLFYENWASQELWQKHMNNQHLKDFVEKAGDLLANDIELSTWYINK
ncbi:MAG: putative quinol monooxygenase [Hyphomicrobiales bacterium]